MNKHLFLISQYLAPQHLLSKLIGKIANCKIEWIKNTFIDWFIKRYQVNMSEALKTDAHDYETFNVFFTRKLKDGARIIANNPKAIISPVDGKIYQFGKISHDQLIQAKGKNYSLHALLGNQTSLTEKFIDGEFITLYLAPKDYHRVHMPFSGELKSCHYIPGKLFSVNPVTTENIENLFARNERLICEFTTSFGPMIVIFVGAMIVSGISTIWAGKISKNNPGYPKSPYSIQKGDELGYFELGSTAIVLFPKNTLSWSKNLTLNSAIMMGQEIGNIIDI